MSPGMSTAKRYARYLFDCVKRYLRPPILEIGAGYGTYTPLLLKRGRVIAVDVDGDCLRDLRARYPSEDLETGLLDLNDQGAVRACRRFQFQSAFSSNVFEHIADDEGALRALGEAIVPGGYLGLIVPAHPRLYGYMDSQAGHFRRYTRRSLSQSLREAHWQVRKTFYI